MNYVTKAISAGAVAVVANATPLYAADLPAYEPPPPVHTVVEAPALWQGISVGVIGGYGWGKVDHKPYDFKPEGGLIGGLVGLHGQQGNLVYGVEGDASFSFMDAKDKYTFYHLRPGFEPGDELVAAWLDGFRRDKVSAKISSDSLFTGRARLGYAVDQALLYATGGIAATQATLEVQGEKTKYKKDKYGVTPVLGGGVEYKLENNFSIRGEYLYMLPYKIKFNDRQYSRHKAEFDGTHLVRVGLSYSLPIF
ncbi:outer membrane immunogenic protein [Rhodoligotrophos appendicifer]|uniref:outer membrane protein n=1 Tax=Rhodoligotrophos appendicifer TaxID=987056 RepID=UPI00118574F8|nr:outer membrane beta-barrel protein [Rhodoligotrophos appendicifer]